MSVATLTPDDAYQRILRAIDEQASAQQELTSAKQRLDKEVLGALRDAPTLAATLYWDHEIKASVLASALGVTVRQLRSFVGVDDIEVQCPCGELFIARCRSHEQRRRALRADVSCIACSPRAYGGPERLPGRRDLDRVAALRSMEYPLYLRTEEWLETRAKALDRARHMCQVCSSKYGLEVHHRTYDRLGTEQPRDLIVLCRDCHRLFHANGRLRR